MRKAMLVACLGAGLNCACSFIFVKSPPPATVRLPPSEPLACTSGKVAPVLDTLVAGYQVFRTGYALSKTEGDYVGAPISRNADIGFGIGLTALFAASSMYGYATTSQCAEAKEAHERQQTNPSHERSTPETFTFTPNRPKEVSPRPEPTTAPPDSTGDAHPATAAPAAPATSTPSTEVPASP